ncbi:hypothetical protein ACTFBT_02115 [Streptomyces microflavus]|uniref:LPXTG-motif cell wall anchor domain-containing protein n=1 Tax=Streptomyces microflavus TaxID=1919 RepID=A0A7J0CG86_STRMI|nr:MULTISPECIES: hypothetical protein [Streptomyces]MDX2977982.1 hypothetical protein [Streptomyces sp. NRRL_B-2249]GFN01510.1 hypothetical protein Smic_00660 [Streptomyces microflavus]GGX65907.1 hypothetical protein GCM10010298_33070 [Streptomyces microflavus]
MRSRFRRIVGPVLAVIGLTGAALLAPASPAGAAPQPIGRCTASSGVVLAVDFSHWGGPVYRSCGTTPTTGYELLNQGGWQTTGTGHDGPAFICRIGYSGHQGGKQYPRPQQEDCVLTPPASAYWSYWHANPGENTWEYSQLGAMSYKPRPGSVDLWIFGGTDIEGTKGRPTITPDQLRAHNTRPTGGDPAPKPKPDPVRTTPQQPGGGGQAPPPPDAAPSETAVSPSPFPSATASPSASPSPSPSASVPASASPSEVVAAPGGAAKVVDAAPVPDAEHDSGSVVPVAATAGLVAVIGGAAVFAAKRRRRAE